MLLNRAMNGIVFILIGSIILGGCTVEKIRNRSLDKQSKAEGITKPERTLFLPQIMDAWNEVKEERRTFTPTQLFDIIDGGAERYTENGLVKGVYQNLKHQTGPTAEIFIMRFSAGDSAKMVFDDETNGIDREDSFSHFLPLEAVAESHIGGSTVYGYLGDIYFTVILIGFEEEDRNRMIDATGHILSAIKEKVAYP